MKLNFENVCCIHGILSLLTSIIQVSNRLADRGHLNSLLPGVSAIQNFYLYNDIDIQPLYTVFLKYFGKSKPTLFFPISSIAIETRSAHDRTCLNPCYSCDIFPSAALLIVFFRIPSFLLYLFLSASHFSFHIFME